MKRPRSTDFGPLAASYDRLRPVDENWWDLFELLVAEGDLLGRRVLDVGCGTGTLARALAERGARAWGIDPSEEMLAEARSKKQPGASFKRAHAETLPFKDGWFERAVLRLVVHLLDRPRAFDEVRRVLAPGGRIVVATFDPATFGGFWLTGVFPSVAAIDVARFPSAEVLESELAGAGFSTPRRTSLVQDARLGRDEALTRIRGRFVSTLRLLDEDEFGRGLERAERELPDEIEDRRGWIVLVATRGGAPIRHRTDPSDAFR